MNFEPFEYMAWAKAHSGRYAYDFSVSGMPSPEAELFALDPSCLMLDSATPELRHALKQAIASEYGVAAEHVMFAAGTSEANFLAYATLLSPGDIALVESTAYQILARLPAVLGARTFSFERGPSNAFAFDLAAMQRAWQPGVKLVALTSPHNPSGTFATEEELLALGAWLDDIDAYAVVDEVYRDFNPTPPRVGQALHPRLITTASLTKVYGLGNLRAGWVLMPPEHVKRAEQLFDFMAVNPAPTMMNLALSAFPHLPTLRQRAQQRAAQNREIVARWLEQSSCFSGTVAPHGIISLLRLDQGASGMALSDYLKQQQVLVTPGEFFNCPGTIRIAYSMEPARLPEALARLEAGAKAFLGDY